MSERRLPDASTYVRQTIGQKRGREESKLYHLDRIDRFSKFSGRLAKIVDDLLPTEERSP